MLKAAIYPGTFDPLTLGHVDLIHRASRVFERLIIAVSTGFHKKPLFTLDERVEMAHRLVRSCPNIEVESFDGLLVNFARNKGVHVLVRGIRAFSDFEYEFQMALTNRKLAPDIETLFMMPKETHSYLSSSSVREVAFLGGDISAFVPDFVQEALKLKISQSES